MTSTIKTPLLLTFSTVIVAGSLFGCSLLKKKGAGDAGADGGDLASMADAATVSVTGTGAKNEANILRYASETPLANEPAVIAKDGTVARNFPGNGPEVATLAKGTAVAKIAQYFSTATLVMFDDPSGDGSKLLGWVIPGAFDLAAPPPVKPVVVPARVVISDAGAKDASAVVAMSGGDAGVKLDAGVATASTVAAPPAGAASATPVGGKCPGQSWQLMGSVCRPKCTTDADCPKSLKCTAKRGLPSKVCTVSP